MATDQGAVGFFTGGASNRSSTIVAAISNRVESPRPRGLSRQTAREQDAACVRRSVVGVTERKQSHPRHAISMTPL